MIRCIAMKTWKHGCCEVLQNNGSMGKSQFLCLTNCWASHVVAYVRPQSNRPTDWYATLWQPLILSQKCIFLSSCCWQKLGEIVCKEGAGTNNCLVIAFLVSSLPWLPTVCTEDTDFTHWNVQGSTVQQLLFYNCLDTECFLTTTVATSFTGQSLGLHEWGFIQCRH